MRRIKLARAQAEKRFFLLHDATHKARTSLAELETKTETVENWPRDRDQVSIPNIPGYKQLRTEFGA